MNTRQNVTSAEILKPTTLGLFEKLSLAVLGSIFLVISAKLMVPFWPVPMTFQPLAVIMVGVALGPRLGLAAVMTYLAEGFAGLPVFASPESLPGLAILAKPSAGFLMSFPITAYVAGLLVQRGWTKSWLKTAALFFVSYAIMYSIGMTWFVGLLGAEVAFSNMFLWIPGDLTKIGLGITSIQAYKGLRKCA